MAEILLSETEKRFIRDGVEEDIRGDGRRCGDYRPMELETEVVTHANGSARLRLANTDVLVGVKTEVDAPLPDRPGCGKIEFFVDCSANATPEFEGRGGEQLATSISSLLVRAYQSPHAFDLQQLCILNAKQCWKLYVDILILECGGNLCDAVSLAVKAALFNTRIPCVKAALMDGGNVDLQLSDDPYDCKRLDVGSAPLLVTLCKIGKKCIVDPTAEEERCSVVTVIVGLTGNPGNYASESEPDERGRETADRGGRFSTVVVNGTGSFLSTTLKKAIKQGQSAALALDKALSEALFREQKQYDGQKKEPVGFLK